jgi:hypothetical protein
MGFKIPYDTGKLKHTYYFLWPNPVSLLQTLSYKISSTSNESQH